MYKKEHSSNKKVHFTVISNTHLPNSECKMRGKKLHVKKYLLVVMDDD